MNQAVVCHIIQTMLSDAQQIDSREDTFSQLMNLGTAAHAAGDPVKALTAFESALELNPHDSRAVSACAALLFELSRPRAAFALLLSIESQLLLNAEGCANLGLAALGCNHKQQATAYFEQSLKLQHTHAAALTHLGMLAAREQRWIDAADHARQCVTCTPNDETAHANLMDYLLGARCAPEALQHFHLLPEQVRKHPKIGMRHIVALALNAQFEAANQAMAQLDPQPLTELANFLQRSGATGLPDLFYRQARDAMLACDWRDYVRQCAVIGQDKLHQGHRISLTNQAVDNTSVLPPFSAKHFGAKAADPIRIGIAATSLRDAAATAALAAELLLYDSTQFTFHIYSPTPEPQAVLSAPLAAHHVVEIAHFNDEEAVWRIRLDRLDIWFDLTCNTPWYRPKIAIHRVASLQVLSLHCEQQFDSGTSNIYDCTLQDDLLPGALPLIDATVSSLSRQTAGLPPDAFVICVFGPTTNITPKTFAHWAQLLKLLPQAVLWLSPCPPYTQANLLREAKQADVMAERLVFAHVDTTEQSLLPLADLYLAMSGNSDMQTLTRVMRANLPGIAMVSNITIRALYVEKLHDCIFDTAEACFAKAMHLAQNPAELKALRERMSESTAHGPVDAARSTLRKAVAWAMMVKRSRAGLMPATFDVPLAGTSG